MGDFICCTVGSNGARTSSVFKGNVKDTRSEQESFGSRICVNSVENSTVSGMLTTDLYSAVSIWQQMVHARVSCRFFYRHPVELEDVTDGEFLGTILNANLRTPSFQQPAASCQFRPFRSAGTEAHKLSAAAARLCLASRYSFADQQARSDVQQLVRSYLEYDYPATKLKQLADKFLQSRC